MMRIVHLSTNKPVAAKRPAKNEQFMADVADAIASRQYLDEKRANEIFTTDLRTIENLKTTLNKLKQSRDEML